MYIMAILMNITKHSCWNNDDINEIKNINAESD